MKKVLVGLSGGVDSAIAAYLLKEQGYDVTCAFMRNWDSLANADIEGNPTLHDDVCSQERDYQDAQDVARKLGLPLLRVDFIEEYWQNVFQTFLEEYRHGRTPNPDILCNRYIKFDSFYDFALSKGFNTLATGHYAKMGTFHGKVAMYKADDRNKDQSYFLCQVQRDKLEHILFPLGHIDKPQVRQLAEKLELSIAKKKDSTGICFIGEREFRKFLSNYLPMKPGKIININTNQVVGEHKGVLYYTIGQRKGLDIGGIGPFFVVAKNVYSNELYVTDAQHIEWLISDAALVDQVNILADFPDAIDCTAKFRYRQQDIPVHIQKVGETSWKVSYPQGSQGVTPGQEAVFYLNDVMLGGGVIEHVYKQGEDLMEMICNKAAQK